MDDARSAVTLRGLHKRFGPVVAVDGVDLEIADGEFFSMLGPSGSGKTTVLRMVAGFEEPTEGTVLLEGKDVTRLAPFERDVCTVFQDYALFPSMNVRDNVAYGLRVRGVGRSDRSRQADEALAGVRLEGYGDRKPAQLSGGQRQRVALARALVVRPKVLLLDEPLGALDLKLREQMQIELKQIQREVGITFVFVTHDQEEALTMSDRIAVFDAGRIQQVGTPADLYERPATTFVAAFVGTSNLLEGDAANRLFGDRGTHSVRPEKIHVSRDLSTSDVAGEQAVTGTVAEVVYAGASTRFIVDLDTGGRLVALEQNVQSSSTDVAELRGSKVRLSWQLSHGISIGDPPGVTADRPTPGRTSR